MPKKAIALRHVAFEDLGLLAPLLQQSGYEIRMLDAFAGGLEQAGQADLLIVLGGPIGVYEEAAYPFLTEELRLIGRRLEDERPTLGLCLGAQLLARALGARVYPGGMKEIGWSPLRLTAAGRSSVLAPLGDPAPAVLHWHGDTFDPPPGATHLAASALYQQQAFALGRHVLGLQFHLEVEAPALEAWLVGHAAELAQAKIEPASLRAESRRLAPRLAPAARAVFTSWLEGLAAS